MRKLLPFLVVCLCTALSASSQCSAGATQATLNWEFLEFFPSGGHGTYTTLAQSQTQKFMFGGQKVTVTHNYIGLNAPGENADHTGSTAAGYSVEDLQFVSNGSVTFTFENAVEKVQFSLYDIDLNQRVTVTALNGGTAQPVTMAAVNSSAITVSGSGTNSASGTSVAIAVANTSNDGTVNVSIAGPVTRFTITVDLTGIETKGKDKEDGSLWLSNILACTPTTTLPSNYFQVSKPFPGQPGYVLAVRDNNVYYVDPTTGRAKFLFTDPGHTNINSMAYDPVNHYLYYVYSLTGLSGTTNPANKVLRRYDYNMDTFGVVLNDITTIGIPSLTAGVESGAASFYNGSLYFGIESSTYESVVWKVDFNSSNVPVTATQQFGISGPNHDWADFGVSNGVLYDFDGDAVDPDYYQINLLTGAVTLYAPAGGYVPKQTAIDWNDRVYDIGGPPAGSGEITPYLYNGTLDNTQRRGIVYNGVAVTGSWGDGAEAFKPKADFGDAPSSYDPDPLSPALHEIDPNLKLGTLSDNEWNKSATPGLLADQDGSDEDGLPYVTILNTGGNYQTNVNVFNNTGANATVCAWVDFNNDGIFQAGEGISQTLASNASVQSVSLFWNNPGVSLPNNSYTFIRIRVTSAVNGMTVANPTGFFDNGEVEDYRVLVNTTPLAVKLTGFEARKSVDGQVDLQWQISNDEAGTLYELQKSKDQQNWTSFYTTTAAAKSINAVYEAVDLNPFSGVSYYRLKIIGADRKVLFSSIRMISMDGVTVIQLGPNPASSAVRLSIQSSERSQAVFRLVDVNGNVVYRSAYVLENGANQFTVPVANLMAGFYQAEIWVGSRKYNKHLLIRK